jgi:hypothetical protein
MDLLWSPFTWTKYTALKAKNDCLQAPSHFNAIQAQKVHILILQACAAPTIANFGLYIEVPSKLFTSPIQEVYRLADEVWNPVK